MANAIVYQVKITKLKRQKKAIESAIQYYEEKLQETKIKQKLQNKRNKNS